MKSKSPLLLWMLGILFFAASGYYILQVIRAIQSWNMLVIVQYRFSQIYPVIQGLVLGGAFLVGGILLLKRLPWATTFNAIVLLCTTAWSWLDRTLLSLNPRPLSQQVFAIVLTLLLLGLILGGLWSLQPSMLSSKEEALEESYGSSSSGGNDEH